MRFRLISYNIHKGIGGMDRTYRLDRVIAAIAHYHPDFVLLQEVDDGAPRSRRHCQVQMLSSALSLTHFAFQPNVLLKTGCYGNAILSRYSLSELGDVDLTMPLKKRRRAQVAACRLRDGSHTRTLIVTNVHLGLSGYERQLQLRRLLASELLKTHHHQTPLVIGGDFNDVWGTLGRRVLHPAGFISAGNRIRTFPAAFPVRPLDRVFYRGDLTSRHAFAGRSEIARQASDHLPLVADFELT
jgi:endonuclease/exonuclease/phosphatase family metal-dependent hydrolase